MDDIGTLIKALHTLCARVETLRGMEGHHTEFCVKVLPKRPCRPLWQNLYTKFGMVSLEGVELLLPGRIEIYHGILDDAYAAYEMLETSIDALGQDLEQHRTRLDKDAELYGP